MQIRQQLSVEDIKAEISQQFGFIPPFFTPALGIPQILENLWQQTRAYLNNPLPDIFKEQLATYLSCYCHIPYCVISHSCALHALGMTGQEILPLLTMPLPDESEIDRHLTTLRAETTPLCDWPERGSVVERALLACTIHIFAQSGQAVSCRNELERLLGNEMYQHLMAFFATIKMAHFWVESHPELSYENSQFIQEHLTALLHDEPALAHVFRDYGTRLEAESQKQAQHLMSEREQAIAAREESQARLEIERALLEAVLMQMPAGVIIAEAPSGKLILSNAQVEQTWRHQFHLPSEVAEYSKYQGFYPDGSLHRSEDWPLARAISRGEVVRGEEITIQRGDGTRGIISVSATPVRDRAGNIIAGVATNYDITERKRLEATLQQTELLLIERARQLEAIFDAMVEGIIVYDTEGRIIQTNRAMRTLLGIGNQSDYTSLSLSERAYELQIRDPHGLPFVEEQLPALRILRDEIFNDKNAVDMLIRTRDGRDVILNISGASIRDASGHIVGCVTIHRDVTEQRKLSRRTHETLNALLSMAEALVQTTNTTDDLEASIQGRPSSASAIGRRLAELTCSVLGCERVAISAVEPETEMVRAVAVVGLAPQQEQQWWIEQEQQAGSLRDNPMPEMVARLRANEVLVIDMTQPPFNAAPNPYRIRTVLTAPMCVGNQLVGLLSLDYGGAEHRYTENEIALAHAVARLGALVIERERLLHEQAQAQASIIALRQANQRMDEFLSMASHELRTPLTSIKGNIQLAERRLRSLLQKESEQNEALVNTIGPLHDMLNRADRQVKLLNRLVGDLLDVSRIEARKLEMITAPFDLTSVVREIVQEQRRSHPTRTIRLELPTETVSAIGDADRIGQVVINYLTNALKYSDADRPVEVSLSVEGNEAHLYVRDEGPGLPPAEQERIWERFYQVPTIEVQTGSGVGLGLGLHISKTIIERHQGQVGVESAIDKGSTFWFTLPLTQEGGSEAAVQ